jgi:hypothetical protein
MRRKPHVNLYSPRKRMGSGDPSGLQNRRELALLALVSSTLTRFRQNIRIPRHVYERVCNANVCLNAGRSPNSLAHRETDLFQFHKMRKRGDPASKVNVRVASRIYQATRNPHMLPELLYESGPFHRWQ